MFKFDIQQSATSEERLICFLSDSRDQAFRQALKDILEPHRFYCSFDDYHISIRNVNGNSMLRHLTISSDNWFVWGDTNTCGKNLALNQELISWLEETLQASGLFELREKN